MRVVAWRVWYTEGRTFDSGSSSWEGLPDEGMLLVRLYFDVEATCLGRPYAEIQYGCDTYWRDGDEFHNSNLTPSEVLADRPGAEVKEGTMVADEVMVTVVAAAMRARTAPV